MFMSCVFCHSIQVHTLDLNKEMYDYLQKNAPEKQQTQLWSKKSSFVLHFLPVSIFKFVVSFWLGCANCHLHYQKQTLLQV